MYTLNEALARERMQQMRRDAMQSRVSSQLAAARRLRRLTRLAHSVADVQARSAERQAQSVEQATAADYSLVR